MAILPIVDKQTRPYSSKVKFILIVLFIVNGLVILMMCICTQVKVLQINIFAKFPLRNFQQCQLGLSLYTLPCKETKKSKRGNLLFPYILNLEMRIHRYSLTSSYKFYSKSLQKWTKRPMDYIHK